MPTRKQRRRDAKLRRHEYEQVWVDAEGNEIPIEEAEAAAPAPRPAERARNGSRASARGSRTVQPPSWRRVGKRALVFGPLMFVVIMLVYRDQLSLPARVLLTLQMLLLFVPFSYLMDSLFYRAHRRRLARAGESAGSRRG